MDVTNQNEYQRILRREAARSKSVKSGTKPSSAANSPRNGFLRIIAGTHRSRKLLFKVEDATRPMKDRTREAIFNLLGYTVEGTLAVDLFAGTGVLAFESLSRGALFAAIIEKQSFRANEISENAKRIDLAERARTFNGDAFRISHNPTKLMEACSHDVPVDQTPWLVFCCPPYSMWHSHAAELTKLIERWMDRSPAGSIIVIELEDVTAEGFLFQDDRFEWLRRDYRPATIAIGTKIS